MRVIVFTTEVYRSCPAAPVHGVDQADWPDGEYDDGDLSTDSWSYPDRILVRTARRADATDLVLNEAMTAHQGVCSKAMTALAVDPHAWGHDLAGALYVTILPG